LRFAPDEFSDELNKEASFVGFGSIQIGLLLVQTCLADRILVDGRGAITDTGFWMMRHRYIPA
jgi:hypothetical protein